ncbi:MAG: hypothetical protein JNK82_08645 [Myxococcaceae bacterium]|nr:hypothetical protein [Myxococcaceae bacterium]
MSRYLVLAVTLFGCGGPSTVPVFMAAAGSGGGPAGGTATANAGGGEVATAGGGSTATAGGASATAGGATAGGGSTATAGGGTGATAMNPPPLPTYSGGACPSFPAGTSNDGGTVIDVTGFTSSGVARAFKVVVPRNYDPAQKWPVVFGWHWLNASAGSIVREGEYEVATEQLGFIAVAPFARTKPNGDKLYQFNWPFVEGTTQQNSVQAEEELVFFEDMLACVAATYNVDERRVHMMGVSAGGLWTSFLMSTPRANRVASFLVISGGLGRDPFNVFNMQFTPQAHKFPALVLWGGTTDSLGLDFHQASLRLRDALTMDNHFVVTCTHDAGHAMPPIPQPASGTRFRPLYDFLLTHSYGLPARTSPWQQSGLPADAPGWCAVYTP